MPLSTEAQAALAKIKTELTADGHDLENRLVAAVDLGIAVPVHPERETTRQALRDINEELHPLGLHAWMLDPDGKFHIHLAPQA